VFIAGWKIKAVEDSLFALRSSSAAFLELDVKRLQETGPGGQVSCSSGLTVNIRCVLSDTAVRCWEVLESGTPINLAACNWEYSSHAARRKAFRQEVSQEGRGF
jgi:hypothetical protein